MWHDTAIELWLQQVSGPGPTFPPGRKRALTEMSGNARTPTTKRFKTQHDFNILSDAAGDEQPDQATPKPLAGSALNVIPEFEQPSPPKSLPSRASSSHADLSSGHVSAISSRGSKRKQPGDPPSSRSASPTKRTLFDSHVTRDSLPNLLEIPGAFGQLARAMDGVSNGFAVLATRFDGWYKELSTGQTARDSLMFEDEGTRTRARLGDDPPLSEVLRLRKRAKRNARILCSEPSWNSFVHSVVLDMAVRLSTYHERVICEDITRAPISQAEVENPSQRISKQVDYCIALELEDELLVALRDAGVKTLNHTLDFGVAFNPISVSIETKPASENGTEGTLQLQTWAQAQMDFLRSRLHKAGRSHVSLPILPLVMVQGHQWWVYYFVEHPRSAGQARIKQSLYTGHLFGRTDTTLGIYELIAGLHHLIEWSECQYRPWFLENILYPILDPQP
ncbi:Hypothetical predicted protein [Lecanosticta acicola]|uniref:PD-(D/E)XK nuclease-like domain-containing protein n=1 Tax=Lecanosticta acicola TaxID=111012 RepID=A0AAI8Z577_9PEZI|nr:Hypothetical predicted protein [Lecanosticta acicola]